MQVDFRRFRRHVVIADDGLRGVGGIVLRAPVAVGPEGDRVHVVAWVEYADADFATASWLREMAKSKTRAARMLALLGEGEIIERTAPRDVDAAVVREPQVLL